MKNNKSQITISLKEKESNTPPHRGITALEKPGGAGSPADTTLKWGLQGNLKIACGS
jgi:hypothetical protein